MDDLQSRVVTLLLAFSFSLAVFLVGILILRFRFLDGKDGKYRISKPVGIAMLVVASPVSVFSAVWFLFLLLKS